MERQVLAGAAPRAGVGEEEDAVRMVAMGAGIAAPFGGDGAG